MCGVTIGILPDEGFYDLREIKDAKKMPLGLLQASNVTNIRSLTINFTRSAFASIHQELSLFNYDYI